VKKQLKPLTKKLTVKPRPAAIAQALEPRVLFSADVAALALTANQPAPQVQSQPSTPASSTAQNAQVSQLFVVDLRIEDAQGLLAGLQKQRVEARARGEAFEIITLDWQDDGIAKISDALKTQSNVSALHLIGHGDDGMMLLGSTWLDQATLRSRANDFSAWSNGLSDQADILVYGCDFAGNAIGQQSVQSLAQITGADVAASIDSTSNAARSGNWALEYQSGTINTSTLVTENAAQNWQGKLAVFVVTNNSDQGGGSLRQAIIDANSSAGSADTITFNIGGSGVQNIGLQSALPVISEGVLIDGTTVNGYATGAPLVVLNGSFAGTPADGLVISSNTPVTIRGLVINNFQGHGISISGGGSHIITGNFIGIDESGDNAFSNGGSGIQISNSSNNIIGGTSAAERNVISANIGGGIMINSNSNNTIVSGNYIGTNALGNAPLGNTREGVEIIDSANTLIGGTNVGSGNIISGNGKNGIGIYLGTTGTNVFGNFIGLNSAGTVAIANTESGVAVNAGFAVTIGSSLSNGRNYISGNSQQGIYISNASGGTIVNNWIGRNAFDTAMVGNSGSAILLDANVNNYSVGSLNPLERNIIAGSTSGGISVTNTSIGNAFIGNSIYGNGSLGIDLGFNNVINANDSSPDSDTGANDLQNYPTLYNAVLSGANLNITGELRSSYNTTFLIQFYANKIGTEDSSDHGEGSIFLGTTTVTTDGTGFAGYNVSFASGGLVVGDFISSLATVDLGAGNYGNTSEFSQNVPIVASNVSPSITNLGGDLLSYVEGSGIQAIDVLANAVVSDPDSGNFDTGTLTISFSGAGSDVNEDRLVIQSQGNGAGQIGTSGTIVSYGGTAIGTFTGGTGTAPLSITLNANATATATTALIRAIGYLNINDDNPATSTRLINVVLTDGDGGTSATSNVSVSVAAVNDPPFITINPASSVYSENGSPIIIDSVAALGDVDSPNFDGGVLQLNIIANGTPRDVLSINSQGMAGGQIGVSGSNVYYGGVLIGTFTRNSSNISITLNANASKTEATALLKNLAFNITGNDPDTSTRQAVFSLSDGNGGTGTSITKNIAITVDNTLWVNTTSDMADGDTSNMFNLLANRGSDGLISLREAILATNNTSVAGVNQINFAIDGPGAHVINVATALPAITRQLVIDGKTQSGYTASPLIEINGGLTLNATGLWLAAGSSASYVSGLAITNFLGSATPGGYALLVESNNSIIESNYIGINTAGAAAGNWLGIILAFGASNNVIGGLTSPQANVISSNTNGGILINSAGSQNNRIEGNYIGVRSDGVTARPNNFFGIFANTTSTGNIVGGTTLGSGNIIQSNSNTGIVVSNSASLIILGNSISANSSLGIDLGNDGLTLNDLNDVDTGGNDLQNFPVLSSASSSGGNTTILGLLNSNANKVYRIEFFSASVADTAGHGGGKTYLGYANVTTDASGNATINALLTGVSIPNGYFVTATATLDAGGGNFVATSEFANNVVAGATQSISGTIYEDINSNGQVSDDGVGLSGAIVSLYRDNGDGVIGAGDVIVNNLAANSSGQYSFNNLSTGTYWVVADSRTFRSNSGLLTSSTILDQWAEQTYGSAGSVAWNGASYTYSTASGTFLGGMRNDRSDNGASLSTAEHVTRVTVAASSISNVDYGFSYNVITNARDGDDVAANNLSIQGSLRQFIQNSNAIQGIQSSQFRIPASDPNVASGVAVISLTSTLQTLTDALVIDGTTQTTWGGNTNAAVFGAGSTVGANSVTLSQLQAPEIEIRGFAGSTNIFKIQGNGTAIRGLAIVGGGVSGGSGTAAIEVSANNVSIEGNLIGSSATAISDPGATNRAQAVGIRVLGSQAMLTNNIFTYIPMHAVSVEAGGSNSVISNNEFLSPALVFSTQAAIAARDVTNVQIIGNLVRYSGGNAIELFFNADNTLIRNNSFINGGNLSGGDDNAIDILGGSDNNIIEGNLISENRGAGIYIDASSGNKIGGTLLSQANRIIQNGGAGIALSSSALGNQSILRNVIYNNGGLAIDLNNDGVTLNDAAPDADTGPNSLQNFPVLTRVISSGGNTSFVGYIRSTPNTTFRIEYYSATTADSSGYGEGEAFLGFTTVTTDAVGIANFSQFLNGLTLAVNTNVSATATVDLGSGNYGSTSEFSQVVTSEIAIPGITVSGVNGNTSEAGGTASFTVVLDSQPTADVTISVASGNLLEGTVSTSQLTFTSSNWNVAQTVTVTGINETVVDGNQTYSILLGNAASTDNNYNGLSVADVSVTNTDNDTSNFIVVTTTNDNSDGDTSSLYALLSNKGADGRVSLREAIIASNNTANLPANADNILFDIRDLLVNGAHTINLASALPVVTGSINLDATTDSDFALNANRPIIVLSGGNTIAKGISLSASASNSSIRGLVIQGFNIAGIEIQSSSNYNVIAGNYIGQLTTQGTDAGAGLGNTGDGIWVEGSNNTIGGITALDRNVISGNYAGISFRGGASNTAFGNYVGTYATGTNVIANRDSGIYVQASTSNVIGGTGTGMRNIISGNAKSGIYLFNGADNTVIQGNYIGTDVTGNAALGNNSSGGGYFAGVTIENVTGTLIGSNTVGAGNVISGNTGSGILSIVSSIGTVISGNTIGLGSDGQTAIGNSQYGVSVGTSALRIGGTMAAERNTISSNPLGGILLSSVGANNNIIEGNYIGTDVSGVLARGNLFDGIVIENGASNNLIGGTTPAAANRIANNGLIGVYISSAAGALPLANTIIGNSIYQNGSLGIEIGAIGVNTNDLGDSDTGANDLQNYPVLISAVSAAGNTTINGTLNAEANRAYRIEFFSSASGDSSGHGESNVFLGFVNVTTNASGNATFNPTLSGVSVAASNIVTATSTQAFGGAFGSTSEFSQNISATGAAPGITITPPTNLNTNEAGSTRQFSVVLNSPPIANVTIAVSVSDLSEASSSTSLLTFTAANWNIAQIVTITGIDDRFVDGSIAYSVNFAPAVSTDLAYSGLTTSSFALNNIDDDTYNTLVVDTTSDASDGDTSSIAALWANKGADGRISLREAILAANNTVNGSTSDKIMFEIFDALVGGQHTISVLGALPSIDDAVFIDGATDSDFAGAPVIVLSGTSAGAGVNGINFVNGSAYSGMRSLRIDSFSNLGISVSDAANITIGGIGFGNVVTRNTNGGLNVDPGSDNIQVIGNAFGSDFTGVPSLANGSANIRLLGGSGAMIGGTANGAGNILTNAVGSQGIFVNANSSNNAILGNSIYNNQFLGINLGAAGVQPNDLGDSDTGANDLQNYPVLASAVSAAGNTSIAGSLNSNANTNYRIEFFSSPIGDSSGYGEARTYLGFVNVTTDGSGNASFNANLIGVSVAASAAVTATATVDLGASSYGSTSEFALNVLANGAPASVTVSSPTSIVTNEVGATSQFTVVLNTPPSANVTITLSISDASEASLSITTLVFNAANWNIAQTVTVTGLDDSFIDGNIAYSVMTSSVVSSDLAYSGMAVSDVALINNDNDTYNTLVVDTTADTIGGDTSSIAALYANKGADGKISLREAILAANNTANGTQRDRILFNIADPLIAGAHTISVLSELPTITDAVFIDGSSEPDFGSAHVVEIRGDLAGAATGIVITGNGSRINGLTINRFAVDGIHIVGGDSNVITNSYVGVDVTGMIASANLRVGILLDNTTNTTIGGATAGLGNIISGNATNGIEIGGFNGTGAANTVVQNNLIGVNATATATLGNGATGIWGVGAATTGLVVGGGAGLGNTIGGNSRGILISPNVTGSVISFNAIGTDLTGTRTLGNSSYGMLVHGNSTSIASNLIANNGGSGIYVAAPASNVKITDNTISNEPKGVIATGATTGTTISRNLMTNVGQFIDLGDDGLSPNDLNDVDSGPNNMQNTPVLSSVSTNGTSSIRVAGSFNGQANRTLTIEVFEHSLVGQYVGSFNVTTDALGNATFNQVLSGTFAAGSLFSSTSTDITVAGNNPTSEHSTAVAALAPSVSISPISGLIVNESGSTTSFSVVLSTAPTANVVVSLTPSIAGEISLSANSLTFTSANWNIAQTITITGLQDFISDGTRLINIVTSNAASADPTYNGLAVADISVFNQEIPNLAPIIAAPTSYGATEDTTSNLGGISSGLSLFDADAGNNQLDVTLTISNGVFSLGATAGLSFFVGDGNADASMTFRGTIAQINAAIDSLTFSPTANYSGTANLNIFVNDLGNSGSGGALGASRSIPINVAAVNDAPILFGTKNANIAEGGTVLLTSAMLNLFDVDNPSSDLIFTIQSSSADGEFTRLGVSLRSGDSFSQADVNAQLIQFRHFGGEAPSASVVLGASERLGLSLPDFTMVFAISPVNDAPIINTITGAAVSEIAVSGAAVAMVFASDVDNTIGLTFSLSDDAQGAFQINAISGEITVRNPAKIDFETAQQLTIKIKATDANGAFAERDFTIQIADFPEFVITSNDGGNNGNNNGSGTPSTKPTDAPTGNVKTDLIDQRNSVINSRSDILVTSTTDLTTRPASISQDTESRRGTQLKAADSRDKDVWVDLSGTNGNGKKQNDFVPRSGIAMALTQQEEALELNRRRTLSSDSLDYLLNSGKKMKVAGLTPPQVLLANFKLPENAQSMPIREDLIDKSMSDKTFSVVIDTIEYSGMALSVGAVAWATRTGGLLAALMSAIPAWKGLDPLLVLSPSKGHKQKHEEFDEFTNTEIRSDEEAVRAVL
jgi:trimeric autotransporter adhesin